MGQVAGRAAFPDGLVLEHEGSPLHLVALETIVIDRVQVRSTERHRGSLMRIVAIGAGDLSLKDRMRMLETELTLLVEVALEADGARTARINDIQR